MEISKKRFNFASSIKNKKSKILKTKKISIMLVLTLQNFGRIENTARHRQFAERFMLCQIQKFRDNIFIENHHKNY